MKQRSDYGPGERLNKGNIVLEETMRAGVKRARNTSETILDVYLRQGRLSKDKTRAHVLYDSGIRLRTDWLKAGLQPHVISKYSDLISGGSIQGFAVHRMDAYGNWQQAIVAIGPIASNEVIEVCCIGNKCGRERMEILRRGLAVLAFHYGYLKATEIEI